MHRLISAPHLLNIAKLPELLQRRLYGLDTDDARCKSQTDRQPVRVHHVGKPIAMTAGKQATGIVQLGDLAAAIGAVRAYRTDKPRPFAAKTARRPRDGHALLHISPILGGNGCDVLLVPTFLGILIR
jgi:hypothetical protein